jgi:hypothetical protein
MQKIDRLVWAEGACFESYGVKIGIRTNRPGNIHHLLSFFPPSWRPIDPPKKLDNLYSWLVGGERRPNVRALDLMYSGAGRIVRTSKRNELQDIFERDLRMNVALLSRKFVFIHAGVVGLRGRALVMPGKTFTGKSTLVEALVRAGAEYFSDEYAVLDSKGFVHPFAKPISIRAPVTLKQSDIGITAIGGRVSSRPMRVKIILTTRYRAHSKSRFQESSPGQGTLDLVANAVAARFAPPRVVHIAAQATVSAITLRGTRGEAHATVDQLLHKLKTV